jgi:hypothetical protein
MGAPSGRAARMDFSAAQVWLLLLQRWLTPQSWSSADGVAAVEVGHPMVAVVGGRQPVQPALHRPAGPGGGADAERAELVEGERVPLRPGANVESVA